VSLRTIVVGRRVPLVAVAALLGILAVGQFRGQAGVPGLAGLSVAELGVLVANLNTQNDELRVEVGTLDRQRSDIATANARGQSAVEQLRADLARIRAWAGLTGLSGSGVTITIQGPIGADGVGDLVNELRNAGAEGIAIAGIRLVPGVVVAGSPGELSLENTALGPVFEIKAIGSPQILTGTLTRSGGVIGQLGVTYPTVRVTVTPTDGLALPPTDRDLQPADARPHL
jgi:uncharacterized protein YlxW (UPF0749 family)